MSEANIDTSVLPRVLQISNTKAGRDRRAAVNMGHGQALVQDSAVLVHLTY